MQEKKETLLFQIPQSFLRQDMIHLSLPKFYLQFISPNRSEARESLIIPATRTGSANSTYDWELFGSESSRGSVC